MKEYDDKDDDDDDNDEDADYSGDKMIHISTNHTIMSIFLTMTRV